MNVLVTGAQGFLGRNLAAHLVANASLHVVCCDRQDGWPLLAEKLAQADIVFHLAGVNRPLTEAEFHTGNVELTHQVCERLLHLGRPVPLVFSSSIQAELDNPYGRSKRAAEEIVGRYAQASGARTAVYRLPNLFGKWSRPHYNSVVATFCYNIARNLPITVSDPAKLLTLVYVDDVVDAFVAELYAPEAAGVQRRVVNPVTQICLAELAARLTAFHHSRQTLLTPDVSDAFTAKLYATYLSYLPDTDFAYELNRRSDARGCLAEFVKHPGFGQIFVSRTAPGVTRGNHYHHTKTEKFLVLEGEACVRLRRWDDDTVITYHVAGADLHVIDIPPGYTHSLENTGPGELITLFWAGEIFDPAQPDTYAAPVIRTN